MMGTIINSTSPYAFRILMGFILLCLIAPLSLACTDSRETIPVNDAGLTIYSSINPQLIAPVIQDYAESAAVEVFVRYTDSQGRAWGTPGAPSGVPSIEDGVQQKVWACGPAETVIDLLREYEEKYPGLEDIVLQWPEGMPWPVYKEQLSRFAKDVMPAFTGR